MGLSLDLETLIRQHVKLGKRSSGGFEACKCAACNDYKERGGFKFDGDVIIYTCFNCSLKLVFNATESKRPSNKFIKLLTDFGISEDLVKSLTAKHLLTGIGSNPAQVKATKLLDEWAPPAEVPIPTNLIPVSSNDSPWCEVAREYLKLRALSLNDYDFYVSDEPYYEGRLLFMFWHGDRLIFWQGRSMDKSIEPRYINPVVNKDKIIFNYDELGAASSGPIFITEGALDAISIGKNAIALNGSTISAWQLNELKKATRQGRKLVFVIDKNKNGYKLGLKALKEGWHVTTLPDGVDDANKGLVRFGRLWLLNHLASTPVTGFAGELLLKTKCNT